MRKRLALLGVVLLVVGIICVVATVYYEESGEPTVEDAHMGLVLKEGKWASQNLMVTIVGTLLIGIGATFIVFSLMLSEEEEEWY